MRLTLPRSRSPWNSRTSGSRRSNRGALQTLSFVGEVPQDGRQSILNRRQRQGRGKNVHRVVWAIPGRPADPPGDPLLLAGSAKKKAYPQGGGQANPTARRPRLEGPPRRPAGVPRLTVSNQGSLLCCATSSA